MYSLTSFCLSHHFKVAEHFLAVFSCTVNFLCLQIFAHWLKMFTVYIFVHEDIICYFYAKSRSCREKIYIFLHKNTFHCVFNNKKIASWCVNGNCKKTFQFNIKYCKICNWTVVIFIFYLSRASLWDFSVQGFAGVAADCGKSLKIFTDWIQFTIFSCPFTWSIFFVLFSNIQFK